MSVRIVGGRFRSRTIETPAGSGTRPTSDRAREALFSILGSVEGDRVLDVFAGCGALGFEALSRGATHATFVERSRPALAAIAANIASLGVEAGTRVTSGDWHAALLAEERMGNRYDLVLADPPYGDTLAISERFGDALTGILSTGARVVLEYASSEPKPPGLGMLKIADRADRRYGATTIAIIETAT